MKKQGSLPDKYHLYALIGAIILLYCSIMLLVFSMWRLQSIDLITENIVTENKVLTYTLSLLQTYTDQATRFTVCLVFVGLYAASEALNFVME